MVKLQRKIKEIIVKVKGGRTESRGRALLLGPQQRCFFTQLMVTWGWGLEVFVLLGFTF